VAGAWS